MSLVRRISVPNRLRRFINTRDGLTQAQALERADANLIEIRPPGVEYLDEVLSALEPPSAARPSDGELERLYAIANELAGISAVFGLPALGRAAYSLCELLDRTRAEADWNAAAVRVHIEGMRLLRQQTAAPLDEAAVASILAGLDKVVARVAVAARAAPQ